MSVYNGAGDAKFVVKDEAFNYPNPTFKGAGVAIPGLFFLNIFFTLKYFFFTLIPPSRGLAWRSLVYFVVVAVFAYFSCFSCVCRILCGVELCVCVCKYACMCECVTYVCTYIYTQNGAIYTWMHYMCTRQRARARTHTHTHNNNNMHHMYLVLGISTRKCLSCWYS